MLWLKNRVPVLTNIHRHIGKTVGGIRNLLKEARINRHTYEHQFRVAGTAMAMGRALKLSDKEREALGVAATMHDMGYKVPEGKTPATMVKADFDDHAANGAAMFLDLMEHPQFKEYFQTWTPEQRRIGELAIRYHNNVYSAAATDEYERHSHAIPLASKLVRLADKMDIRRERVYPEHLATALQERSPEHRLVPASIVDAAVIMKPADRTVGLRYTVNRKQVEAIHGPYPTERLIADFTKAYKKSMMAVAEVTEAAYHRPATDVERQQSPLIVAATLVLADEGNAEVPLHFTSAGTYEKAAS